MSFIIAVHVNEGIILASDRRTSYTNTTNMPDGSVVKRIGIHTTDSTDKTFLCPNGVGISTCGDASLNGKPITGYIYEMIRTLIKEETDIDDVPKIIRSYFKPYSELNTSFIVAGYKVLEDKKKEQKIYSINLSTTDNQKVDTCSQGAIWDGETLTLTRLIKNVGIKQADGSYSDLPFEDILWNFFTLQDAIDFARYSVETTINTMRFKNVVETVGGNVDILVITPNEARWLQKEALR